MIIHNKSKYNHTSTVNRRTSVTSEASPTESFLMLFIWSTLPVLQFWWRWREWEGKDYQIDRVRRMVEREWEGNDCQTHATHWQREWEEHDYGVATISRLLINIGLFCRISSLLQGFSAKETCDFKEPTNRSHPILKRLSEQKNDSGLSFKWRQITFHKK